MKIKSLLVGAFVLSLSLVAEGQVSRPLPLLQANADMRSATLGSVQAGDASGMYLYSAPGAIFYSDKAWSVDFSSELYPKMDAVDGRLMQLNFAGAYRLGSRHAVMLGYRLMGGTSFYQTISSGAEKVRPFDSTIDLGYAYRINERFSAHVSANFITSWIGQAAYSGSVSLGAQYRGAIRLGSRQARVDIQARVTDLGYYLSYEEGLSEYALPTAARLGASLHTSVGGKSSMAALLGAQYYFLPQEAQLFVGGLGVEYGYDDKFFGRVGYELGGNSLSAYTAGLGVRWRGLKCDLAFRKGTREAASSPTLMLGLGYSF